ncbi:MAG TPA: hypothetical protein ENK85_02105 [Saprospiraceae bacterium]|nr:hypothetical protein [Saprospiraceae bacterium]
MNSLTKASQLLSISRLGGAILAGVVLAKMGLDMETIGKFELLFFLGKAATAFWTDGLAKAILPLFPKLDSDEQKGFFATSALLYFGFSLLTWLVLTLFKAPILTYFLRVDSIAYYDAYVLFLALNIPGLFIEQYYILREKPKSLLWYTLFSYMLYPLYFLLPLYLDIDLQNIFKILTLVAIIRLGWVLIVLNREHWWINRPILRKLLLLATHFMAYILVAMMAEIIDGFIITQKYADPEVFAIFRYGARELPLTTALLSGLSIASVAKLSNNLQDHLPTFRKSLNRVLKITFPVAIIMMLSSPWLFVHFFSPSFRESALVFNTYLLILGSRVLMPGALMMAQLESKYMFWVSIAELALNVVLSLILVQYWGIIGIAWGTVLANYLEKIAYFVLLKRKYQISWKATIDTRWYLAFWVTLHVAYFWVGAG